MSAPVNFYADFQGLASLKHDAKAQDPAALKEAAKQFESLFTQMLLKSMREANKSFGDSMFGGEQGEMYQDMFDDQMAMQLAQGRGLGLADMLIRQLSQLPATSPVAEVATRAGEGGAIASSKLDFVRSMLPHAEAAARELDVDPHALLAQAALETGWGKSVPCNAKGECSFNLFGIKAGGQWTGATVNVPTLEFEDGVAIRKVDAFRAYASPADSFRDYARLISGAARYERALGAGGNVRAFASALQEGGYATDPEYARKLVAVAREVGVIAATQDLKSQAGAPIAISGENHG